MFSVVKITHHREHRDTREKNSPMFYKMNTYQYTHKNSTLVFLLLLIVLSVSLPHCKRTDIADNTIIALVQQQSITKEDIVLQQKTDSCYNAPTSKEHCTHPNHQ